MKKNSLTTAVVAGIAGVAGFASFASAVDLNPDGLGQVLIYPYYTVNKNQETAISVVNTTDVAKAVKVRFLEGYNSREVLDFNLFLSPFDVWTASVFDAANINGAGGGAAITSQDNSCTAPLIANSSLPVIPGTDKHYQAFLTTAYQDDGGPTDDTRTREGHIELISMADLTGGLADDVTHVGGTPPGCDAVQGLAGPTAEMLPPTGGLFGAGAIFNVADGFFYGYTADALDGFTDAVLFTGKQSTEPQLTRANTAGTAGAVAYVFKSGDLITATYGAANAVDAVSAVFASDSIFNEYNVDPGVGSQTDWVVTFPTKRFYVDPAIVGSTAIAPFVNVFDGLSCTVVSINIYDREEGTTTAASPGFSPPNPGKPPSSLCLETNVISFLTGSAAGDPSGVFGSNLVSNIPPLAATGWLRLGMNSAAEPHAMNASAEGVVFNGLPATGFEAVNFVNSNVTPGVLANYSGLFRHRASRSCTGGNVACS